MKTLRIISASKKKRCKFKEMNGFDNHHFSDAMDYAIARHFGIDYQHDFPQNSEEDEFLFSKLFSPVFLADHNNQEILYYRKALWYDVFPWIRIHQEVETMKRKMYLNSMSYKGRD